MNRHRFATALAASALLLATGAGCSDDSTPRTAPPATESSDGSPSPVATTSEPTTSPLEGEWSASISRKAAESTLRAAGMGKLIPRVVLEPWHADLDLRIAGDQWLLFNDGEVIDDAAMTIKAHQVALENSGLPGEAVLRFKVDATTLRLWFVSQNRPEIEPGLTDEPFILVLYTTAPWTRVS
jgi:hypothetical protein